MTVGVASVASSLIYSNELMQRIENEVVKPSLNAFENEKIYYQSVLYIGIMISDDNKIYTLEYNTRTGNPEWIALLSLLYTPLEEIFNKFVNKDFEGISKC